MKNGKLEAGDRVNDDSRKSHWLMTGNDSATFVCESGTRMTSSLTREEIQELYTAGKNFLCDSAGKRIEQNSELSKSPQFTFEKIGEGNEANYRIADGAGNRIATCYHPDNARTVTNLLNRGSNAFVPGKAAEANPDIVDRDTYVAHICMKGRIIPFPRVLCSRCRRDAEGKNISFQELINLAEKSLVSPPPPDLVGIRNELSVLAGALKVTSELNNVGVTARSALSGLHELVHKIIALLDAGVD